MAAVNSFLPCTLSPLPLRELKCISFLPWAWAGLWLLQQVNMVEVIPCRLVPGLAFTKTGNFYCLPRPSQLTGCESVQEATWQVQMEDKRGSRTTAAAEHLPVVPAGQLCSRVILAIDPHDPLIRLSWRCLEPRAAALPSAASVATPSESMTAGALMRLLYSHTIL